jgi:hypothetical protein
LKHEARQETSNGGKSPGSIIFPVSTHCLDLNLPEIIISDARICESGSPKMMQTRGKHAKLKARLSKSTSMDVNKFVEFIRRGISGIDFLKYIYHTMKAGLVRG